MASPAKDTNEAPIDFGAQLASGQGTSFQGSIRLPPVNDIGAVVVVVIAVVVAVVAGMMILPLGLQPCVICMVTVMPVSCIVVGCIKYGFASRK